MSARPMTPGFMLARQEPLRERYRVAPEEARITDGALTVDATGSDPVHGRVRPGAEDYGVEVAFGIHRAVGGDHDLPNPGDLLCAALAGCLDSTIRMIADRHQVPLTSLTVETVGEVDVRGTLMVDRSVPVGFQAIHCRVVPAVPEGTDPEAVRRVLAAAERSCVVLQTLRAGVKVEVALTSDA